MWYVRLSSACLALFVLAALCCAIAAQEPDRISLVASTNPTASASNSTVKEPTDLVACAPKDKSVKIIERNEHSVPSPASGKGTVCVFGSGPGSATSISANSKWVGEIRNKTYFCFESVPGLVTLCANTQGVTGAGTNPDILALTVEPKQLFYVEVIRLGAGALIGRLPRLHECKNYPCLVQLTKDEGEKRLSRARLTTIDFEK